MKVTYPPDTMNPSVTNLGKSKGFPFCMVYLFTSGGTVKLSGSMDRVNSHTVTWPPCHGIIHWYLLTGFSKSWQLFGRDVGLRLDRIKHFQLSPEEMNKLPKSATNRNVWALTDTMGRVIQTWRKLPSCFLKQFEPYRRADPHCIKSKKQKKGLINWRPFYPSWSGDRLPNWRILKVLDCRLGGLRGRRIIDPTAPGTVPYLIASLIVHKPKMPQPVDASPARRPILMGGQSEGNFTCILIDVDNDKWSYLQGDRVVNLPPRYRFSTRDRGTIYDKAREYVSGLFE
jgi:hypothetical protein